MRKQAQEILRESLLRMGLSDEHVIVAKYSNFYKVRDLNQVIPHFTFGELGWMFDIQRVGTAIGFFSI